MIRASAIGIPLTPPHPSSLAGYGSAEMIDEQCLPLKVRALHVRAGTGGIMIVAVDSYSLSPRQCDDIRRAISRSTLIPCERIMIHATHVHNAPPMMVGLSNTIETGQCALDPLYGEHVINQVKKAVPMCAATTQAAELAVTVLPPPHREFADYDDMRSPMQMMVIRQEGGGALITIILHGPVPPCIMGQDVHAIGGDVPAAAERCLQERHSGLPLIYLLAPSGDYLVRHGIQLGMDAMNALAEDWVRRIEEALDALDDHAYTATAEVHGIVQTIDGLPRRRLPSRLNAWARLADAQDALLACPDDAVAFERRCRRAAVLRAQGDLNMALVLERNSELAGLEEYRKIQLQAIRINGLRILGLQGMLYTDSVPILAKDADSPLWVVGNANGDLQGYIPTPRDDAKNPPARVPSPFAAHGVPRMLSAAKQLADRI
jgi:hypothetical protein